MSFAGQRWWIVGASEGLGRALAVALDREGAHLVVSARNRSRLEDLTNELDNATALTCDVTDVVSVEDAITRIGDIDGVIYCAGLYEPMAAQHWEPEAAERICDVNFNGAMRVLGRLMPQLLRQDRAHVALIGSLAGYTGLPGAIGYGASKAAIMHLGETMQRDLRGTGIKVQVINPGFIKTRLTDKNSFEMPMIQTAEDAAVSVMRALRSERFMSSFPAPFAWVFRIAALLPRWLVVRLI